MSHEHIPVQILPIDEITDLMPVAYDLHVALQDGRNKDLALDFPSMASCMSYSLDRALAELEEMRDYHHPGEQERFVAFAGGTAVGLSAIEKVPYAPSIVDPEWSMVWSFIVNPWRGQGIGTQVMSARMKVINERFGGNACAAVRPENTPSQRALVRAGFQYTGITSEYGQPNNVYTYHAAGQDNPVAATR